MSQQEICIKVSTINWNQYKSFIFIQSFKTENLRDHVPLFSYIHFREILYLALRSAKNSQQQLSRQWVMTLVLPTSSSEPLPRQVTINITATFLYNTSAILRTDRVGISYNTLISLVSLIYYGLLRRESNMASSFYFKLSTVSFEFPLSVLTSHKDLTSCISKDNTWTKAKLNTSLLLLLGALVINI